MALAFAADAHGLPSLGQAHDELPPLSTIPIVGPRVDVNCSLLRHCECAVRVLRLKAAEGQPLRPPRVEAAFVNCVLEHNKLALALTPASLVRMRHCTLRKNTVAAYEIDTGGLQSMASDCEMHLERVLLQGATWFDWRRPSTCIIDGVELAQPPAPPHGFAGSQS